MNKIEKLEEEVYLVPCKSQYKLKRGIGAPNTVIIQGTNETAIIDPGVWTYNLKVIKEKKETLPDMNKVNKILLTHQHWDHTLAAHYFQKKYNAAIFAHEKEKNAIENKHIMYENMFTGYEFLKNEIKVFPKWINNAFIHFMWGPHRSMNVNKTIREGETILKEPVIEVVHLPSHTEGLVGFYLPKYEMLIAGDLIDLETGIGLDLNNPLSSYEKGLESLRKVSKMKVRQLVPGHGEIVMGKKECQKLFEARINETKNTFNKIVQYLKRGKTTLKELIHFCFPETKNDSTSYWLRRYYAYCILEAINKEYNIKIEKRFFKSMLWI